MDNFESALDRLISEWKRKGCSLEDMISDLECAAEGLQSEIDEQEEG
jgi:predicted  nucleic acid-binding Zn-ribbon protein